jgi:tRNA-binding protein
MEKKHHIDWSDFEKIDLRVGTILDVRDFLEARKPAYQLHIDFGTTIGILKSSAQIASRYSKEELLNRQIVAVVNFPKKQIGTFMSQCLILGAVGEKEGVVLLHPDLKVENGTSIA